MNILLCVPGRTFSANWLHSWNDTVSTLQRAGHTWGYSMQYDPVIYYARNRVLGGDNTRGRSQSPFQGQVAYDYLMWIDSDMVWRGTDVLKLIEMDVAIASGCYLMHDNQQYTIVENLDYNRLAEAGTFQFMDRQSLDSRTGPFKASYVGFGFTLVARGVFESMEYPWFQPRWVNHGNFHDFTAEDVGFCWTAQEKGYDIWVNPAVRVGHEKNMVLA